MPQILIAILIYALPVMILILPFIILCFLRDNKKNINQVATKPHPPLTIKKDEPQTDIDELTEKLNLLIKNNVQTTQSEQLYQQLSQTPSHIIAGYSCIFPKNLKGFHLFQLIFSLLNNNTDDAKIIRILRHYLPSSSTAHLYALLKSCKEFLNLIRLSPPEYNLFLELQHNQFKHTLLFLRQKMTQTLDMASQSSYLEKQSLLETAAKYGLIFASFSEFYNSKITEDMLNLVLRISYETFINWHTLPIKRKNRNMQNYVYSPLNKVKQRSRITRMRSS